MKYKIIEHGAFAKVESATDEVERQVNMQIADGWEPVGGVSISVCVFESRRYYTAAQALVKK